MGITMHPHNDKAAEVLGGPSLWEGGGVDPSFKAQALHTPLQLQDEVSLLPPGWGGGGGWGTPQDPVFLLILFRVPRQHIGSDGQI